MNRTIKITGKGKIEVSPDQAILSLYQNKTLKTYGLANDEGILAKHEIDGVLDELGIDKSLLKNVRYSVSPEYQSYKRNDEWKQKLVGYSYNHEYKLKVDLNHELLGKLFKKLTSMEHECRVRLNFGVKNPEKEKNRLIAEAVRDSQQKALVLTEALNVSLQEVVNIDYSWMQVDISSRSYEMEELCTLKAMNTDSAENMEFNPEDIELSDSVTVTWAIE